MQSFQPEQSEPSLVGWASTARPIRLDTLFRWTSRHASPIPGPKHGAQARPGGDATVVPLRSLR